MRKSSTIILGHHHLTKLAVFLTSIQENTKTGFQTNSKCTQGPVSKYLYTYVEHSQLALVNNVRAVVAILKLVGPGPYPQKKSGRARARGPVLPYFSQKVVGPGPNRPIPRPQP